MFLVASAPFRTGHHFRQMARRFQRRLRTRMGNGPGNPTRITIASVFPNNRGQLRFRPCVDHLRRRQDLRLIHPHIQRTISLHTESAVRVIQLRRANAQVQQHPIQGTRGNPTRRVAIGIVRDLNPIPKCCQTAGRRRDRTFVTIRSP